MKNTRRWVAGWITAAALAAGVAGPAEAQTCGDGTPELGQDLCVSTPWLTMPTFTPVLTVLAADVNGDGHADVIAVTAEFSYLRLGTGSGLGAATRRRHAGSTLSDVAVGDFDGDGRPDLALADQGQGTVLVRYNLGGAGFSPGTPFPAGPAPRRVLAARMDGDARDDLVVLDAAAGTASVLLSTGAGFAAPAAYAVGDARDIALGDSDGDATPDLYYLTGQGVAALLNLRRNPGLGALLLEEVSPFPLFSALYGALEPRAIVAGDLDGDALADAVVSTTWSQLVPGTSNGNGFFFQHAYGHTWAWTENRLRTVDYDGNGTLDVAAPHVFGPQYSVAWGDGTGSFGDPTGTIAYGVELLDGLVTVPLNDVAFADLDGDGDLDVVLGTGAGVVVQRGDP